MVLNAMEARWASTWTQIKCNDSKKMSSLFTLTKPEFEVVLPPVYLNFSLYFIIFYHKLFRFERRVASPCSEVMGGFAEP